MICGCDVESVSKVTDWWRVTVGGAPDELVYTIETEDEEYELEDDLTDLVRLYLCARDRTPSAERNWEVSTAIVEKDDQIALEHRYLDASFPTTYASLEDCIGSVLSEIFQQLDTQSTSERRNEAFAYLTNVLNSRFQALYEEILDGVESCS
ncbi:hypothetical protein [Haloparvum sp. AD34]